MKFAAWPWLFGTGVALLVAVLLVVSGLLLLRSLRRFGDDDRMAALVTGKSGGRRAFKGVLLVLALAFAFLAAAQPQYGHGTRRIPATNLDVAIVLDFSKSMYARDVTPSRIERAKSEVASLIGELPGARFSAIAFAGEPMKFPLTSDGAAITQFFRQLAPNDMPVGGTAIGRALTAAHEVLTNDPLSSKSEQVVLLITDGEDLEGNPVAVAQTLGADGITVHVVQIGGRTPEPIPDIDEQGEMVGWRTDEHGNPLTTALSAEGEAALGRIAGTTGGIIVRSAKGATGISKIAARMRVLMTEELSEKVETVYADVFHYPLGVAILLLVLETFVAQARAPKRGAPIAPPPPKRPKRRKKPQKKPRSNSRSEVRRAAVAATIGLSLAGLSSQVVGCETVDEVFVRHSPEVDQAINALDAGDAAVAVDLLQEYLKTGACSEGEIGIPDRVKEQHNAGFDLGLGLFRLAEEFGRRFGDEEKSDAPDEKPNEDRAHRVRCALRIVRAVTADLTVPTDLRARAHYLSGNLEFLRKNYRDAINEYNLALRLIPGVLDAGEPPDIDTLGNDAAWNRAIAIRRLEEEQKRNQDAGADSGDDGGQDGGDDGGQDGGDDGGQDGGDDGGQDGGDDGGQDGGDDGGQDGGDDGGQDGSDDAADSGPDGGDPDKDAGDGDEEQAPTPPPEQELQPQDPEASQDDRILDELEKTPSLQQHRARRGHRQRPSMEDK